MRRLLTILSLIGLGLSVGSCVASTARLKFQSTDAKTLLALYDGALFFYKLNDPVPGIDFVPPPVSKWFHPSHPSMTPMVYEVPLSIDPGIPRIHHGWLPRYSKSSFLSSGVRINDGLRIDTIIRKGGLYVPLYLPSLLFGVIPTLWFFSFLRSSKREELGLCVKCGYDLRGSKDRCPECGEAFESPELKADH